MKHLFDCDPPEIWEYAEKNAKRIAELEKRIEVLGKSIFRLEEILRENNKED